jgi:toxin YoeB
LDVHFSDDGWDDYLHWSRSDPDLHRRLNEIIENLRRTPFSGLGKPEALKGDLSGWWSRRITGAHRLVYRIQGRKGEDQRVVIIQGRYHY